MAFNTSVKVCIVHLTSVSENDWLQIESDLKRWNVAFAIADESIDFPSRSSILGRWLTCRLLLTFDVPKNKLNELAVTDLGKPYLPNSRISFSVSHSYGCVACAATQGGRVGIDLELIRPINYAEYHDCFTPGEWMDIQSASDRKQRFLEKWTEKESLLKADGRGMQVSMADVQTTADLTGRLYDSEAVWRFQRVSMIDYVCTICVDFSNAAVVIEPITIAR